MTGEPGWSPRLGAAGAVFQGRMWLLGGVERYYDGTPAHLRSDVWSSADGKHWKQETAQAPWAPRAYHAAVAFRDRLWVFGGGNYLPEYEALNDVWSSADGVHWSCVTPAAPWTPRIFRDRLWVAGGMLPPLVNDVWYLELPPGWPEGVPAGGPG